MIQGTGSPRIEILRDLMIIIIIIIKIIIRPFLIIIHEKPIFFKFAMEVGG